ncbi:hypothetical protein K402DRAFT_321300, partial [Aulographum hederae CBS 113979]
MDLAPLEADEEDYPDCMLCGGDKVSEKTICPTHKICEPCVIALFELAERSEISYPPRCCIPLDIANHLDLLDPELVEKYKKKEVEYKTPHQKRRYCANPRCSAFLPPGTYAEDEKNARNKEEIASSRPTVPVTCASCGFLTCITCKALFADHAPSSARSLETTHRGHRCTHPSLNFQPNLAYSPLNRCKACPSCSTFVWLSDGCNHIACEVCEHEWCFICLSPHASGCDCPQYNDPEYDYWGRDWRGLHRDTGRDRDGYDVFGYDVR